MINQNGQRLFKVVVFGPRGLSTQLFEHAPANMRLGWVGKDGVGEPGEPRMDYAVFHTPAIPTTPPSCVYFYGFGIELGDLMTLGYRTRKTALEGLDHLVITADPQAPARPLEFAQLLEQDVPAPVFAAREIVTVDDNPALSRWVDTVAARIAGLPR